ncbi:MAG: formylglycine-generating enzyme family protein [Candidatus Margulisiibacteriota bacterium]
MIGIPESRFVFQRTAGVRCNSFRIAETPFTNGQFRRMLEINPRALIRALTPVSDERFAAILRIPASVFERRRAELGPASVDSLENLLETDPGAFARAKTATPKTTYEQNLDTLGKESPWLVFKLNEQYCRLGMSMRMAVSLSAAEDCPMVFVNRTEAADISSLFGCRLGTELEWERAASYTDGRTFPWGSDWNKENVMFTIYNTHPVKLIPSGASPEGIYSLAGNVEEWTSSSCGTFDLSDPENPVLPKEGSCSFAITRGGSWHSQRCWLMRNSFREREEPEMHFAAIGFRLFANAG